MVSLFDFMVGTFGMIPWVCVCTYIGSALNGISDVFSEHHSKSYKTMLYTGYAIGSVTTAIVVYMISVYTRRAVQEAISQGRQSVSSDGVTEEGDEEEEDEVEVPLPNVVSGDDVRSSRSPSPSRYSNGMGSINHNNHSNGRD